MTPEHADSCVTIPHGKTACDPDAWRRVLRVLKPGAHLLALSGVRDYHRVVCAIEDAGFEIRDCVVYLTSPIELICLARKPLSESTVAANVLRWGTGALNVDGCRIEAAADYHDLSVTQGGDHFSVGSDAKTRGTIFKPSTGRWPANVIHDGSDEVVGLFPDVHGAGSQRSGGLANQSGEGGSFGVGNHDGNGMRFGDSGSAARFFYCAKDRKQLREYLIRLVTPPGGVVYDPFAKGTRR